MRKGKVAIQSWSDSVFDIFIVWDKAEGALGRHMCLATIDPI
jgi:hypothetical protein